MFQQKLKRNHLVGGMPPRWNQRRLVAKPQNTIWVEFFFKKDLIDETYFWGHFFHYFSFLNEWKFSVTGGRGHRPTFYFPAKQTINDEFRYFSEWMTGGVDHQNKSI